MFTEGTAMVFKVQLQLQIRKQPNCRGFSEATAENYDDIFSDLLECDTFSLPILYHNLYDSLLGSGPDTAGRKPAVPAAKGRGQGPAPIRAESDHSGESVSESDHSGESVSNSEGSTSNAFL